MIILLNIFTNLLVDIPGWLPEVTKFISKYPNTTRSIIISLLLGIPLVFHKVKDYIKEIQKPRLLFSGGAKFEKYSGFGRLYIEIRNKPKRKADNENSTARNVWAEIRFKNVEGEEVYSSFYNVRWSGTPAPTALDFITQQPADYYEKTIKANGQPVKLYLIAKKLHSKDIYVHNALSYKSKSKNIRFRKEQRLKNKEHIIEITLDGDNTEKYLLELKLQPEIKNPPTIKIQKCYILKGKKEERLPKNDLIEEV